MLTSNEVHDSIEGALISQHKLTLFLCNARQSFQGEYSCSVRSRENGFEDVSSTFSLTVSESSDPDPSESSNPDLIMLIGIPVLVILLVVNMVAISTMAGCCLSLRRKSKRNREATVDNHSIPRCAVENYYARPPESKL